MKSEETDGRVDWQQADGRTDIKQSEKLKLSAQVS